MAGVSGIKRKALSVSDKLNILKSYDEGCASNKKQKDIAKDLGLAASTLRTIVQNRRDIEEVASQGSCKRQKIKHGKFDDLEKILLEWFHEARSSNLPINGNILTEKAHEIARKLNLGDFTGSCGWLDRFKTRHGIIYRKICGESESVNEEDVTTWATTILPDLLKDYAPEDVYNADELGLFFKLMPDKSLVYKNETCHGGKLSKERLTVLTCANSTGTDKLKLLVIGKSRNPRCFKNVKTFPCAYVPQHRAWMTAEIFKNWVTEIDKNFGKQKRKVILFIDNCPAHPKEIPTDNVKIVFLPPNATSRLQPLDQGVIKVNLVT